MLKIITACIPDNAQQSNVQQSGGVFVSRSTVQSIQPCCYHAVPGCQSTSTPQVTSPISASVPQMTRSVSASVSILGTQITPCLRVSSLQPYPQGSKSLQPFPEANNSSIKSTSLWNIGHSVGKRKGGFKSSSKSKRKKIPTWTHTFVCLSRTDDDMIPDADYRAELQIAGLGEQHITFLACADMHDIFSELSYQFPRLVECGGFELLRASDGGGKQLNVIASPESGYTASYLRAVVHHAKIFIRPLQKNLSLEPIKDGVSKTNVVINVI